MQLHENTPAGTTSLSPDTPLSSGPSISSLPRIFFLRDEVEGPEERGVSGERDVVPAGVFSCNCIIMKYRQVHSDASSKKSPWRPPTRKTVSSTLLDAEVEDVGPQVAKLTNGKKSILGGTLPTDGWTDQQDHPIVNIVLAVNGVERFLEACKTTGHTKDMTYLADLVSPFPDNIDAGDSDGACADMLRKLEDWFHWVTGILCKSHSIDLYLKDIRKKEEWTVRPIVRVKRVVRLFKRHQQTLAMVQAEDGTKTFCFQTTHASVPTSS